MLPLLRYCLPVIDEICRIAMNQFCILNYFLSILVFTCITRNTEYQYCQYSVSQKSSLRFSDIFPQRLGSFSPNYTRLLHVPIYGRLQIFIQLSPTVTKLFTFTNAFSARQHAERAICYRKSVCLSVCPSVRHTGGSVENG